MQYKALAIDAFLSQSKSGVILDVRSPKEFANGHIPGAANLPLFTDEERHRIGLTYKQEGHEKAVYLGLQQVGPKLTAYIDTATTLAPEKKVFLYCWRGGMRSNSMALLLQTAGFTVVVLQHGYKAYRNHVLATLAQPLKLINIGGFTGTGKTELLQILAQLGKQTIDLEGLAKHKGSAFGNLENNPQPSTEQFENTLAATLAPFNKNEVIFVEDESITIGKVRLPHGLFAQLQTAPLLFLQQSEAKRQERLAKLYGAAQPSHVADAFSRLKKRLGGKALAEALEAVANHDVNQAAKIALQYYDKSYYRGLEKRKFSRFVKIDANGNPKTLAKKIITLSVNLYE